MGLWPTTSVPRWKRVGLSLGLVCVWALGSSALADETRTLAFARRGEPQASVTLAELREKVTPVEVSVYEPYEKGEAKLLALPFADVLDAVYGKDWREEEELLFTCRDGYQPTVPVQRVLDHRAYLAFDRPGPIGFTILKHESGMRKTIPLAPFYLVWDNRNDEALRRDADYGWPYQLVGVDLIRTRDRFPKMTPSEGAPPNVLAGFRAFRIHCSRCHKINGEGGTIGPELNLGESPVEYRKRDWLRVWIENPTRINPGARMERLNPALPNREQVIRELIDYLEYMAKREPGPESKKAASAG